MDIGGVGRAREGVRRSAKGGEAEVGDFLSSFPTCPHINSHLVKFK